MRRIGAVPAFTVGVILTACNPSAEETAQSPSQYVARDYVDTQGNVQSSAQLEPTDDDAVLLQVVLKVVNEESDIEVEYHYRHRMGFMERSAFELWAPDRHMYDLVLPIGYTWGDLVSARSAPPMGPSS